MNNQNWNPQHPQPAQQMPPIPQSKSGMAIAGFVLGIIALLTSFLPIINNFSFFLAILGMIFGIVGMVGIMKGKKSGKGLARRYRDLRCVGCGGAWNAEYVQWRIGQCNLFCNYHFNKCFFRYKHRVDVGV